MENRFRKLRLEYSLSQDDVADMLSLSRECYGMYDRGQRSPSYQTLVSFANKFHVSADYLLCRTDIPDFIGELSNEKQEIICLLKDLSDEATKIVLEIIQLDARSNAVE